MRIRDGQDCRYISLDPGEYVVSNQRVVLTTLLGSCVAACLYDPCRKIVGMNHFLLSSRLYDRDKPLYATAAGRYGIHSMELLLNEMWSLGAKRGSLQAKAFGGASLLKTGRECSGSCPTVGDVNVTFIKEFLQNEDIPLISSDLGGVVGRVIHFYSEDFAVYVRKLTAPSAGLLEKEERYWKKSIQTQDQTETQIDLWR